MIEIHTNSKAAAFIHELLLREFGDPCVVNKTHRSVEYWVPTYGTIMLSITDNVTYGISNNSSQE